MVGYWELTTVEFEVVIVNCRRLCRLTGGVGEDLVALGWLFSEFGTFVQPCHW